MKIIAFDIDGTTINRFRNVTPLTLRVLKSLHDDGYILVPTSGRCLNELPQKIINLGICDYAITSNGSKITNLKTQETMYDNSIPSKTVVEVLKTIDLRNWMISIHTNNEVYDTHNFLRISRRLLFHKDFKFREPIKDIYKFLATHNDIEKVQLTTTSKTNMDELVKKVQNRFALEMPISRSRYIEITNKGVNKLNSVQILCDFLNIKISEVFSIGDDMNDLDLIKKSGVGVAMGNANNLVKAQADYVTSTNRQEGFYFAIKKYFPDNIKF